MIESLAESQRAKTDDPTRMITDLKDLMRQSATRQWVTSQLPVDNEV